MQYVCVAAWQRKIRTKDIIYWRYNIVSINRWTINSPVIKTEVKKKKIKKKTVPSRWRRRFRCIIGTSVLGRCYAFSCVFFGGGKGGLIIKKMPKLRFLHNIYFFIKMLGNQCGLFERFIEWNVLIYVKLFYINELLMC